MTHNTEQTDGCGHSLFLCCCMILYWNICIAITVNTSRILTVMIDVFRWAKCIILYYWVCSLHIGTIKYFVFRVYTNGFSESRVTNLYQMMYLCVYTYTYTKDSIAIWCICMYICFYLVLFFNSLLTLEFMTLYSHHYTFALAIEINCWRYKSTIIDLLF